MVSLESAIAWEGALEWQRPADGDPGIRRRSTESSTRGLY